MKIVFLGTGGTYPSKSRNVSSIAVQMGSDVVMFDCGEGTQRQLMYSPISFMRIRAIFITHLHADHFLGVPGLIQSMSLNGREERLRIVGPPGTAETVARMLSLGYFASQFEVVASEVVPGEEVRFEGFSVVAGEATHTVPALAYAVEESSRPGRFDLEKAKELGVPEGPMFRELQQGNSVCVDGRTVEPSQVMGERRKGRKLVYSGDTRPCGGVLELARGADALIHDCTLGSDHSSTASEFGHSTAREAAEIAKTASVRRLFLIHFSPRYDDLAPLEAEARAVFPNAFAARDLEVVDVPYRNGSHPKDEDVPEGNPDEPNPRG
jgi:ribonuclease Z